MQEVSHGTGIGHGHGWQRTPPLWPLRHRHALAAAHGCYDPLVSCPWVAALNKFTYRLLVINTELQTSDKKDDSSKYDDLFSTDYVTNHLFYMVEGNLTAQADVTQPRTWRLPVCVNYSDVEVELNSLSDGSWGALGAGACLVYLIQRYHWDNEERVSIYLYGGACGLNSLLKPHHQLDAELAGVGLAQKEVQKALESLKTFNLTPKPRLISDSQTSLSLCCKPAVTLVLGTG